MLYLTKDMEILDQYTEEDLIKEAIETNSVELEVSVEKFIMYDKEYDEVHSETIGSYTINLMEYVDVEEIIEYAHFKCKENK